MLDLETLGTAPGSAILAIGAVKFGGGQIYSEFYEKISLINSVACGFTIDPATVLWWMQQSDEARAEFAKPARSLSHVLEDFSHWVFRQPDDQPQNDDAEIWGNGASFDNVLLSVAYDRAGHTRPWKYSNDRCYRTVKNIYKGGAEMERTGTHHNALDDARSQAMHLMAMLPNL